MAGNGFNKGYIGINKLDDDQGGVRSSRKGYTHNVDKEWRYDPTWVRNPQWLEMPEIPEGEQKVIVLFGVQDTDDQANRVSFRFRQAYTVDWGDGSSPENFNDNTIASHEYTFSSISSDTETDAGLRQVLITVTPQTGNITVCDFQEIPSNYLSQNPKNYLDLVARVPNCTSFLLGSSSYIFPLLERARILELGNITSLANLFYYCFRLRYVEVLGTGTVTNFASMFFGCNDLQVAPYMDTSSATNMGAMFQNCNSLRSVPRYNTSNVTSFSAMFSACNSLRHVPPFDISSATTLASFCANNYLLKDARGLQGNPVNCTNFSLMFSGCYSLLYPPEIDTSAGTNFASMFSSCTSLVNVPHYDTSSGTLFTSMFQNCNSIQEVPLFDLSSATTVASMFYLCYSLLRIPNFVTTNCTNFSQMFRACQSLRRIDWTLDTSSATTVVSMFTDCYALFRLPTFDLSNISSSTGIDSNTTSGRMLYRCYNLAEAPFSGTQVNIRYNQCKLGRQEIIDIFNGLAVVGTATIVLTQNPGTSSLSASDLQIATLKGWTVTT